MHEIVVCADMAMIEIASDGALGTPVALLQAKRDKELGTAVIDVACHPQMSHIAWLATIGDAGKVGIWNVNSTAAGARQFLGHSHSAKGSALAWHAGNENCLVSASENGELFLWDVRTVFESTYVSPSAAQGVDRCFLRSAPARSCRVQELAWSGCGAKHVFAAGWEDGAVTVYDERRLHEPLLTFTAHSNRVMSISWHPHWPGVLLTGGKDMAVRVWDVCRAAGEPLRVMGAAGTPAPGATAGTWGRSAHAASVQSDATASGTVRRSVSDSFEGYAQVGSVASASPPMAGRASSSTGLRSSRALLGVSATGIIVAGTGSAVTPHAAPVRLADIRTTDAVRFVRWRPGTSLHVSALATGVLSSLSVWDASRPGIPVATFQGLPRRTAVASTVWVPSGLPGSPRLLHAQEQRRQHAEARAASEAAKAAKDSGKARPVKAGRAAKADARALTSVTHSAAQRGAVAGSSGRSMERFVAGRAPSDQALLKAALRDEAAHPEDYASAAESDTASLGAATMLTLTADGRVSVLSAALASTPLGRAHTSGLALSVTGVAAFSGKLPRQNLWPSPMALYRRLPHPSGRPLPAFVAEPKLVRRLEEPKSASGRGELVVAEPASSASDTATLAVVKTASTRFGEALKYVERDADAASDFWLGRGIGGRLFGRGPSGSHPLRAGVPATPGSGASAAAIESVAGLITSAALLATPDPPPGTPLTDAVGAALVRDASDNRRLRVVDGILHIVTGLAGSVAMPSRWKSSKSRSDKFASAMGPADVVRHLALQYRLEGEGRQLLCEHNAAVAAGARATEVSLIWRALGAMLPRHQAAAQREEARGASALPGGGLAVQAGPPSDRGSAAAKSPAGAVPTLAGGGQSAARAVPPSVAGGGALLASAPLRWTGRAAEPSGIAGATPAAGRWTGQPRGAPQTTEGGDDGEPGAAGQQGDGSSALGALLRAMGVKSSSGSGSRSGRIDAAEGVSWSSESDSADEDGSNGQGVVAALPGPAVTASGPWGQLRVGRAAPMRHGKQDLARQGGGALSLGFGFTRQAAPSDSTPQRQLAIAPVEGAGAAAAAIAGSAVASVGASASAVAQFEGAQLCETAASTKVAAAGTCSDAAHHSSLAPTGALTMAALRQRETRVALRRLRHRFVDRVLEHCSEQGDVQMCVSVVRVMGRSARRIAGKRRLQRWVEAYVELLHRLRLWGPASTVMARSRLRAMQRRSQRSTRVHLRCSECSAVLSRPAQPPDLHLPSDGLSSDEGFPERAAAVVRAARRRTEEATAAAGRHATQRALETAQDAAKVAEAEACVRDGVDGSAAAKSRIAAAVSAVMVDPVSVEPLPGVEVVEQRDGRERRGESSDAKSLAAGWIPMHGTARGRYGSASACTSASGVEKQQSFDTQGTVASAGESVGTGTDQLSRSGSVGLGRTRIAETLCRGCTGLKRGDAGGRSVTAGAAGAVSAATRGSRGPVCSACQEPVRGLYVWCQFCGHGGHLAHLSHWFASVSTLCPAGCGHSCDLRLLMTSAASAPGGALPPSAASITGEALLAESLNSPLAMLGSPMVHSGNVGMALPVNGTGAASPLRAGARAAGVAAPPAPPAAAMQGQPARAPSFATRPLPVPRSASARSDVGSAGSRPPSAGVASPVAGGAPGGVGASGGAMGPLHAATRREMGSAAPQFTGSSSSSFSSSSSAYGAALGVGAGGNDSIGSAGMPHASGRSGSVGDTSASADAQDTTGAPLDSTASKDASGQTPRSQSLPSRSDALQLQPATLPRPQAATAALQAQPRGALAHVHTPGPGTRTAEAIVCSTSSERLLGVAEGGRGVPGWHSRSLSSVAVGRSRLGPSAVGAASPLAVLFARVDELASSTFAAVAEPPLPPSPPLDAEEQEGFGSMVSPMGAAARPVGSTIPADAPQLQSRPSAAPAAAGAARRAWFVDGLTANSQAMGENPPEV